MTALWVLIDAPPAADREFAWVLAGRDGGAPSRGRARLAALPAADTVVAIVDAPLVHVTTLALPPIAPARLDDAVRFALDDRLAAAADSMRIVHGAQAPSGRVRAVAAASRLVEAIVAALPRVARVVALPGLVPEPPPGEWHWLRGAHGGFVVRGDGSALATDADDAPPEIALALREARRAGELPARVVLRTAPGAAQAGATSIEGVPVVAGAAWSWDSEAALRAASDAAVPDFLAASSARAPARRDADVRLWRRAAMTAAAALAVFALGGVATAAWLAFEQHRDEARATALARDAGVEAAGFEGAMAAIARRDAEARHARGELADDDALALLARAAPALAMAPAGAFRRATYASGAWTLDYAALEDAARDALVARLADAGLVALSASSAGGTRLRIQR